MDQYLQQEIKELLEHLDARGNTSASESDENQQATEVIDVFVIRRQGEESEPPTVESTLAETSDEQETRPEHSQQEATELAFPPPPRKARRRWLLLVIGAFCLLVAVAFGTVSFLTVFASSSTVTIIPASTRITTTGTVTIVSGNANAAQQQVSGRLLDTITLSQAKTVPATGMGHEPARVAHGLITFYNALPAPQTIPAGELLTGADGVEVVTLQGAAIPAGTLATNGQVSVPAQAINAGPGGNIAAGDIYGKCCRDDVFVSNSPFRGGQNARSYQMVTQQDIDSAASSLKASLDQSVQAALRQQVQPGETLVTPTPCTSAVTPDHKTSEEASHVQVTVSEACRGEVYDTNALHGLLTQTATQQADRRLGNGYGLVGDLQTSITQAAINTRLETATLQVKAISTWVYEFSQAQQEQIKLTIRGKSKQEATSLLLHMPGVESVSISTRNGDAISTDEGRIHLNLVILT